MGRPQEATASHADPVKREACTLINKTLTRELAHKRDAGIITDEEFQQFRHAKGKKQRLKVIHDMWRKYYGLACGSEYEPPFIQSEMTPRKKRTGPRLLTSAKCKS
jgi:hypothetical protein